MNNSRRINNHPGTECNSLSWKIHAPMLIRADQIQKHRGILIYIYILFLIRWSLSFNAIIQYKAESQKLNS